MESRFRTRWVVAAFILIGVLLALLVLIRDLRDADVPEETGTAPAAVR